MGFWGVGMDENDTAGDAIGGLSLVTPEQAHDLIDKACDHNAVLGIANYLAQSALGTRFLEKTKKLIRTAVAMAESEAGDWRDPDARQKALRAFAEWIDCKPRRGREKKRA